jgi:hypothetical protein
MVVKPTKYIAILPSFDDANYLPAGCSPIPLLSPPSMPFTPSLFTPHLQEYNGSPTGPWPGTLCTDSCCLPLDTAHTMCLLSDQLLLPSCPNQWLALATSLPLPSPSISWKAMQSHASHLHIVILRIIFPPESADHQDIECNHWPLMKSNTPLDL